MLYHDLRAKKQLAHPSNWLDQVAQERIPSPRLPSLSPQLHNMEFTIKQ